MLGFLAAFGFVALSFLVVVRLVLLLKRDTIGGPRPRRFGL
jgi:hypothetical protein